MARDGKCARLFVEGDEAPIELPMLKPSLGNEVIDIGALLRNGTSSRRNSIG